MQLIFERFETQVIEDLLSNEIVTLLFQPNDMQIRNMHDYIGVNTNHFEIVFNYKTGKILNEMAKIQLEVDCSYVAKQKLTLKEMLELSNIHECIVEAVEEIYFGCYKYSNEALELFYELEHINRQRLIDKALDTGDRELFIKLMSGVI